MLDMKNNHLIRRIPVAELRLGMYIHKLGGSWFQHPFWKNSFLLDDSDDLQTLLNCGIPDVWIDLHKSQHHTHAIIQEIPAVEITTSEQLLGAAPSPPEPPSVPLLEEMEQARKFCLSAGAQIQDMFDEARMGKAIDPADTLPLVREIAASVGRHPQALISVARLKTQDTYTYLHSVAVCALMISLAQQLKLSDDQTRLAGLGGLMHDLGKAAMPLDILNKPGRLTTEEYDIMKTHPVHGIAMLQEGSSPKDMQDIVLYHHEKLDGSGYPSGLMGDAIPLLARMGAVCDVYDAVTSIRPYKSPWSPAEAMRQMARWEGHFDRHVFESFVKAVGIYPVGSLVRLRSGRLAVVRDPGLDNLLTPQVMVFYEIAARRVLPAMLLDLADPDCNDSIQGPEDPDAWGFTDLTQYWLHPE